jgi:hypothetical protein
MNQKIGNVQEIQDWRAVCEAHRQRIQGVIKDILNLEKKSSVLIAQLVNLDETDKEWKELAGQWQQAQADLNLKRAIQSELLHQLDSLNTSQPRIIPEYKPIKKF